MDMILHTIVIGGFNQMPWYMKKQSVYDTGFKNLLYRLQNTKTDEETIEAAKAVQAALLEITEKHPYGTTWNPDAAELAELMEDSVNASTFDIIAFNSRCDHAHRTLQQRLGSMIFQRITHVAKSWTMNNNVDGRNLAFHSLCCMIVGYCEANNVYIGQLPLI